MQLLSERFAILVHNPIPIQNCEKELLKNRDVRKALSHAFDVDRAIKDSYAKIMEGGKWSLLAKRINGPFNKLWGLGIDTLKNFKYSKVIARRLLDDAGI